jgi:aminopeptidase N
MRTSVGQPVRLADYHASDYLIDHVELDVSLDIHATRVVSTLSLAPNPAGRQGAALALDGDELSGLKPTRTASASPPASIW